MSDRKAVVDLRVNFPLSELSDLLKSVSEAVLNERTQKLIHLQSTLVLQWGGILPVIVIMRGLRVLQGFDLI